MAQSKQYKKEVEPRCLLLLISTFIPVDNKSLFCPIPRESELFKFIFYSIMPRIFERKDI